MTIFDYIDKGRRPTAAMILADWKRAGRPRLFSVTYGETCANFERVAGRWIDDGNGCRGVNRAKVVKALAAADGGAVGAAWS